MACMRLALVALIPGAVALVQRAQTAAGRAEASSSWLYGRLKVLQSAQSRAPSPSYPCYEHPHMCREPFNCHLANASQHSVYAVNGHANLQSWCSRGSEKYADTLVKQCLVNHDLRAAGLELLDLQARTHSQEYDGSYCFLEGHCSNADITDQTTVEEAEKACDKRFGHGGWAGKFLRTDLPGILAKVEQDVLAGKGASIGSEKRGYGEQKITRMFAKLACAMGNFHCDVQYCKRTYCQIDHYKKKYGHLAPPLPGQDIIDLGPT